MPCWPWTPPYGYEHTVCVERLLSSLMSMSRCARLVVVRFPQAWPRSQCLGASTRDPLQFPHSLIRCVVYHQCIPFLTTKSCGRIKPTHFCLISQLGAPGVDLTEQQWYQNWTNKLLQSAGSYLDFFVLHPYQFYDVPPDSSEGWATILAAPSSYIPAFVASIAGEFAAFAV